MQKRLRLVQEREGKAIGKWGDRGVGVGFLHKQMEHEMNHLRHL